MLANQPEVVPEEPGGHKDHGRTLHIDDWCIGCGACVARCLFAGLTLKTARQWWTLLAVFCGYCGAHCPEFAIKVI